MKWASPIGINIFFWSLVGSLRYFSERNGNPPDRDPSLGIKQQSFDPVRHVAVCLPAHNEAVIIDRTIASLRRLVPANQIYVVSDDSTDQTAALAKAAGCNVLELSPGRGKARAIEVLLDHFYLLSRYQYILIADADTTFNDHFLRHALPLFSDDHKVAVVSAYTKAQWRPHNRLNKKMYFIAYRLRMYQLLQALLTYGQTWRWTNVNPVIPGFACLYRSDILRQLSIAVPGIIIEDFSVAFQLHKKKLGRIAHHPSVYATTQDPDNLRDYWIQVQRWNMGLLQTIKYWKVWPSFFWLSLGSFILETFLFYLLLLLFPLILIALLLHRFAPAALPWVTNIGAFFSEHYLIVWAVFLAIFLVDYLATLVIAWKERVDMLAVYGPLFFLLRYLDALILVVSIPKAFLKPSNGIWSSPTRRQ